ncbi:hypothetical protein ACLB6G_12035 [Zhengella sp. ZM62]|uniref:hypothetical protein n=1 Tax=Zhengella sedimenti TaxID=3390035 RepID=UPI0039760559
MKTARVILAVFFLFPLFGAVQAAPDCRCRANGTEYRLDEEVCIRSAGKPFRARCVMVLNNTSWLRTGDCEQENASAAATRRAAFRLDSTPPLTLPPDSMCEPARWTGKAGGRPGS